MCQQRIEENILRVVLFMCVVLSQLLGTTEGVTRDICTMQPTINGLCGSTTLGIYYDVESQKCHYMGCSSAKRLFNTLEDCQRICNNNRHRRMRDHQHQLQQQEKAASSISTMPTSTVAILAPLSTTEPVIRYDPASV